MYDENVHIRYYHRKDKKMEKRRKDSHGRVLKEGESERKAGGYDYRWRTSGGQRHAIYAPTLEELREKEKDIIRDKSNGIRTEARNTTLNDIYDMWVELKRGLKDNTFQNYQYMYNQFVYKNLGQMRISQIKRSDVRRFYNMLADERNLKISTIDSVHTVLHQVFQLAVEDNYIRANPSDNSLKELKQAHNMDIEKRRALTLNEQIIFTDFLENSRQYNHWKPIFDVMLGTGLRVGEVTGLRWEDIDLDKKTISVNHTLVYYNHKENGCYFNINTPKTKAGNRIIYMTTKVKEAFEQEKKNQELAGISCKAQVDGYTNFVFVNRFGNVQHQGTLNKALRRITRDCNDELLEKAKGAAVTLLPPFSCHNLRHTFATRMCEAGVNAKVVQELLGHADVGITLNIYTDATKDLIQPEMAKFEHYLNPSGEEKTKESNDLTVPVVYGSPKRESKFTQIDSSCKSSETGI